MRPSRPDDAPFLRSLFIAVRRHQFPGIAEPELGTLLDFQWRARENDYSSRFPTLKAYLIEKEGGPIGAFMMAEDQGDLTLVDIAIEPLSQGRGMGTMALQAICAFAAASGWAVTLRVDLSNPAKRLYERLGFRCVGDDGMSATMRLDSDGAP